MNQTDWILLSIGLFFLIMFVVFLVLFIQETNKDVSKMNDNEKQINNSNKVQFGLAFGGFGVISLICAFIFFKAKFFSETADKRKKLLSPEQIKSTELTPLTPGITTELLGYQDRAKNLREKNPFLLTN